MINLVAGRFYFIPWIGASLNLTDAPWKGKAKVYDLSLNGQAFISGDGSSSLQPVQKLVASSSADIPVRVYLFRTLQDMQLNNADVGSITSIQALSQPAPAPPAFTDMLPRANGDSYYNAMTLSALAGVIVRYNEPTAASSPTPGNNMALYLPNGMQVASLDYAVADEGHACSVTYMGTTYTKNATTGALLTFTNGNVTLAL